MRPAKFYYVGGVIEEIETKHWVEPFFINENQALAEKYWEEKLERSRVILGSGSAIRQLRPEVLGDRVRADLMWDGKNIGIRGPMLESGTWNYYPIKNSDVVTAEISEMISNFDFFPPPVHPIQFRFRSSMGKKGLWIDCSNENIKNILEEKNWLATLVEDKGWHVEMGQKHKQAYFDAEEKRWALKEATPHCWLPSYNLHGQELHLKSLVSSFSQPGPEVNRALIVSGFDLLDYADIGESSWVEWGAGYGNLSAAYASRLGAEGASSEMDSHLAALLDSNSKEFFPEITTLQKSVEATDWDMENAGRNIWILDPPRPGFPALLNRLKTLANPPQWILTYHCHQKGLQQDSWILKTSGYKLVAWSAVDAFPVTPHLETISLWKAMKKT